MFYLSDETAGPRGAEGVAGGAVSTLKDLTCDEPLTPDREKTTFTLYVQVTDVMTKKQKYQVAKSVSESETPKVDIRTQTIPTRGGGGGVGRCACTRNCHWRMHEPIRPGASWAPQVSLWLVPKNVGGDVDVPAVPPATPAVWSKIRWSKIRGTKELR